MVLGGKVSDIPADGAFRRKFYIIWTVFNASFVPIVYLFYPETAGRTLEDVDRFFMENHDIFIFKDPDAVSSVRPAKYAEREATEVRRNSSVPGDPSTVARRSMVRHNIVDRANRELDEEKAVEHRDELIEMRSQESQATWNTQSWKDQ